MPVFCISFTILGLSSQLIEISFMATTLLEMTNSLGVTTLETFFTTGPVIFSCLNVGYLDSWASVSPLAYVSSILTSFEGFPDSLWPDLFVF